MLKFTTAGESHGPALTAIIEGLPAGLEISIDSINKELTRRQLGYGRGGRMAIEKDQVEVLSGIRFGKTLGSPVTLQIKNNDWANWSERMAIDRMPKDSDLARPVTQPRPGHADLSGILKTGQGDIRNILERSSARETAARVAAGAIAKQLLAKFGIQIISHVLSIGSVNAKINYQPQPGDLDEIDKSPVRCLDKVAEREMIKLIERTIENKNTIGGVFEILVFGCPPGLGSYVSWEERLDGKLARALMAVQAIKAVEIGDGLELAKRFGSEAHDEIFYDKDKGYYRQTNHAGGIEGGMTNGEVVVIRGAMKPIPTLMQPLKTVDILTKEPADAVKERSDVCAVPAAAVVGESVVAFEIARAFLDKFGSDALCDVETSYQHYLSRIKD